MTELGAYLAKKSASKAEIVKTHEYKLVYTKNA